MIRTAVPSLTARDQVRKHLRRGWCNEPTGRKMQLVSWMQPLANCSKSILVVLTWCLMSRSLWGLCSLSALLYSTVLFSTKSHSSEGSKRKLMMQSVSCSTVCHNLTNKRIGAQACSTQCHRGQKEGSQFGKFHSLLVRCSSVWKLIQTSFFQVAWQRWQKYICLPVGGHAGFSLTLSLPLCSSCCWLDKNSSRDGRQILWFFISFGKEYWSSCSSYL